MPDPWFVGLLALTLVAFAIVYRRMVRLERQRGELREEVARLEQRLDRIAPPGSSLRAAFVRDHGPGGAADDRPATTPPAADAYLAAEAELSSE